MYRLATMHSDTDIQTDGKTDRWQYHANSWPYYMQYDRL